MGVAEGGATRGIWVGSIVIRCRRFEEMLAFWQSALGYVPKHRPLFHTLPSASSKKPY